LGATVETFLCRKRMKAEDGSKTAGRHAVFASPPGRHFPFPRRPQSNANALVPPRLSMPAEYAEARNIVFPERPRAIRYSGYENNIPGSNCSISSSGIASRRSAVSHHQSTRRRLGLASPATTFRSGFARRRRPLGGSPVTGGRARHSVALSYVSSAL
jgi:hypothetical protein